MTHTLRECDVLVVGAGPAGMSAAARAAESGARAIVADEGVAPGGQIWRPALRSSSPVVAQRWAARLAGSGAVVLRSTSIVELRRGANDGWLALAESNDGGFQIAARSIVLATGARERFLPFPGWTLPNVVGIGGAQALLKSGMSVRGRRVVIAGTGPLIFPVAASLARAGAMLVVVAEQAPRHKVLRFAAGLWRSPALLARAAAYRAAFLRTPYATGTWVVAAHGEPAVQSVTITDGASTRAIECDLLCAAFGLVPNVELARLAGCDVAEGRVIVDARQATSMAGLYCAGEPTGIGGVDLSLAEGEIAGLAAAGRQADAALLGRASALRRHAAAIDEAFALRAEVKALAKPDTIVCRCEDVRMRELDPRWSARQAKLYTRAGMGACQGRICGSALECVMGWPADSVRPPTQPVRVSTFLQDIQSAQSLPHGAH
ncbi:MAG: Pyridine nucleotide-disulfide oxidoreductase, FAD/NAD(P)-binding domain protein [Gemmatimonadetes bacterium]|nr:Pyridine nucleotide-disulfide oxidoreductase, FAD/NAD(P)-binding domain protein [Gemmatimonadota bacterium]